MFRRIVLTQGTTEKFINDSKFMIGKYYLECMTPTTTLGFPLILVSTYKIFGFHIFVFKSVGIICYRIFVGIFIFFAQGDFAESIHFLR